MNDLVLILHQFFKKLELSNRQIGSFGKNRFNLFNHSKAFFSWILELGCEGVRTSGKRKSIYGKESPHKYLYTGKMAYLESIPEQPSEMRGLIIRHLLKNTYLCYAPRSFS